MLRRLGALSSIAYLDRTIIQDIPGYSYLHT